MKFSLIIAVAALALPSTTSPIEKRKVGGVLICTGANATGECTHKVYKMDECNQLEAPFHKNVNTFAPDGENFICYPRTNNCGGMCTSPTGCTFGSVAFDYEHKYNLSAIRWDTLISSFDCALKDD